MDIPQNLIPQVKAYAAVKARAQTLAERSTALRSERSICDEQLIQLESDLFEQLDALGPYATFFADDIRLDIRWGADTFSADDMAAVPAAFVRKTRSLDKKRVRSMFADLADDKMPSWLNRTKARTLTLCSLDSETGVQNG